MKVYLDINIGDLTAHAEDQAAYSATHEFFARNSAALGLSGSSLAELDAEGQELLSDSFRSRCPDQGGPRLAPPVPLLAGRIVVELNTKEAPKAAQNFKILCTGEKGKGKKSGKPLQYRGVRFHRIVKGFVCQGGDIVKGDGSGGDSIYGGAFKDEPAALKLKHDAAGVVSMANSGKNSNTSQFFFTFAAAPMCDGKHVVLGRVVEGMDVLSRIEREAASETGDPQTEVCVAHCGVL